MDIHHTYPPGSQKYPENRMHSNCVSDILRPVMMQELRTPTLPISLAHSPDGAAFAAFFGGPSLGSLKAPSLQPNAQQQLQPHPPPLSKQASLQAATRQQQQAMQVLQQQQAALKQGQEALRQEQLNLQAAAMRLREQYAALTQQQQGLAAQQPSSPMASSSCESEGAAAHLPGSFSGSDDDVIFAPEQLRRCVLAWRLAPQFFRFLS